MNAPAATRTALALVWVRRLASWVLRLGAAAALTGLIAMAWQAFFALPPQTRLARISLQLAPGATQTLGRHELAAPAADIQHLQLGRDAQGRWWLANASTDRAVDIERDGLPDQLLRSLPLEAGQQLFVVGQAWRVERDANALLLVREESNDAWRFDGATLQKRTGEGPYQALPLCSDARWAERLRAGWNARAPRFAAARRPLQWGGHAACGLFLPAPALATGSLQIRREGSAYRLLANAGSARRVCLVENATPSRCPQGSSLFERREPLAGISHLTVGRTRFAVQIDPADAARLHLSPVQRAGWLPQGAEAPPGAQWEPATDDPWGWAWPGQPAAWAGAALLLAGLVAAAAWRRRMARQQAPLVAWALWSVAQWLALAVYLRGGGLGLGWVLALASVAAASVLFTPQRTAWTWAAHVLLALMLWGGLLLQWQLGVQAPDTGGWNYFRKNAAIGAAGLFSIQAFAWGLRALQSTGSTRRWPGVVPLEAALTLPGLLALVLLALQAMLGAEEGVFGFQPVELAKLALVLLGAHALALRLEWVGPGGWRHWPRQWALGLRLAMPVLLFAALAGLGLMWVNDYSPVLLLAGWLFGLLLAWALARASVLALLPLVAVGCAAVLTWQWVRGDGLAWLQAHGFYADRVAAWLDLPHHLHSGEQVLRALQLASTGGDSGSATAPAWRVPAVQDDMAPAFLLGRFGLQAGVALLALQLAYLGCLLMLGWQALLAAGPGDYRRRWGLRLIFFAAWGEAALFAAHLLLSWGTNTGALPVMGQPMPLISAGGSVIALLLVPLHLLWTLQPELLRRPAPGRTGVSPRTHTTHS